MKKKLTLTACLFLLPFLGFAQEESEGFQQDSQENAVTETQKQEIAQELFEIPNAQDHENISQELLQDPSSEISEASENTEKDKDEVTVNFPFQEEITNIPEASSLPITAPIPADLIPTTFPIETAIGYNLENAESNYFLQATGTDTLNEAKARKINFLVKVPYFQAKDYTNTTGFYPDKFYVNFIDPFLTINLGDNKYNLSALTVKDLEKRGGFLNLNYKDKIGFSALYLAPNISKDKNPSDNVGASIFVSPFSFCRISSNFLYAKFKDETNLISAKNNTYSLRSTFYINDKTTLDLEAAATNDLDSRSLAYFGNLEGKNKYLTYSISGLYASPNFVGIFYKNKKEIFFSDRAKVDGSIKYNVKKFSAKLSHLYEQNNLDKIPESEDEGKNQIKELDKAIRTTTYEFNISYPIINHLIADAGIKTKESKNFLNSDGYKLDAINLNLTIPIKNFSADNYIEIGKYGNRLENHISNWLGYKLFLKYCLPEDSHISIYTKLGNIIYDDFFTISYVAGTDLKIKIIKTLDLKFIYEYSTNSRKTLSMLEKKAPNWKTHHFKLDFIYTFPNEHKFTITSHLNKPLEEKKEKAFLLTYTIPFQVPKINRAIDSVKETLF